MTTAIRFVTDTHAVIWYYASFFHQANLNSLRVNKIFDDILNNSTTAYRLIVPSVVFVEIFDKFCRTEHDARRIYYECFTPIESCPNIEIREIDQEVLNAVFAIGGVLDSHEINDKIVVATAAVLESVVITRDSAIQRYARDSDLIEVCW